MSYSLKRGVETHNSEALQRGLLIGLPVIALLLVFGSIRQQATVGNSAKNEPNVIPVVSGAEQSNAAGPSGTDSANGSAGGNVSGSATPSTTGSYSNSPSVSTGSYRGLSASTQTTDRPGLLPLDNNVYVPPVNVQAGGKPVVTGSGTHLYVN